MESKIHYDYPEPGQQQPKSGLGGSANDGSTNSEGQIRAHFPSKSNSNTRDSAFKGSTTGDETKSLFGSPSSDALIREAIAKVKPANPKQSSTFNWKESLPPDFLWASSTYQAPTRTRVPQDVGNGSSSSPGSLKSWSFNPPSTIPSYPQSSSDSKSAPSGKSFDFEDDVLVSAFSDIPEQQYPKSMFFSSTFQINFSLALQLAKDSVALMEQLLIHRESYTGDIDPTRINHQMTQVKKAGELNNFFHAETIAFLGSSGEGKSSVINSLLDFPRLATAGDFGSACTSIVTEYRQKKSGQSQRIKVEVEYLCGPALEEHIKELLYSFRRKLLPDVAEDSLSAADWNRIKEGSKEAWSALKSVFESEKEFSPKFLSDKSQEAFDRIANQLVDWAEKVSWPTDACDGKWVAYAESAEEFYAKTSLFMQERLWPLSKIMRVYIDAPILRVGLVLADLPGLHDTNLARVRATRKYLSRCDRIFHVCDIRRVLTSEPLESNLSSTTICDEAASDKNSPKKWSRTAIICTMSDHIDQYGAERDLRDFGSVHTLATLGNIENEIRKVDGKKDPLLLTNLQWKKEMLLIDARNKRVKDALKKKYKDSPEQDDLHVFCVSNRLYSKSCRHNSDAVTNEEHTISGIPVLRKFCYSTVADLRLREAKRFILVTLPSFLNSIKLHSQSLENGPTCGTDIILEHMGRVKKEILRVLQESLTDVQTLFNEMIEGYTRIHHHKWQLAATKKGLEWLEWPWAEYQAFCRNNGVHYSDYDELIDWNKELIDAMQLELSGQWTSFERNLPSIQQRMHTSIDFHLQILKFRFNMENFPSSMVEGIDLHAQVSRQLIEALWTDLRVELRGLRARTLGSNEASFILHEMMPAYRAAASFEGSSQAKIKALEKVQDRIENGKIFQNIISTSSSQMNDTLKKVFGEMEAIINDRVMTSIMGDTFAVYSTVTLAKKPMDECDGRMSEAALSLEELQRKCRNLDRRSTWISRQIEGF
ncbi:hypothetical protein PMG11_03258 [Penicillium brasilianum]|uniref:Uncharacterized protein n=1 Tax=Penicillium brasilianum TaxID=104259 RepID=A0A0F7VGZ1_PENBI|nr:hypothetical protein PMG11_03258 [Penicillium brasilianum]